MLIPQLQKGNFLQIRDFAMTQNLSYEATWFDEVLDIAVIPVTRDKRPMVPWAGYQDEKPAGDLIRGWFAEDVPGMAAVCGRASGDLVVRDFDSVDSYNRWKKDYPKWASALPTVNTGRPGRHVYLRCDPKQVERESRSGSGIIDLGDGELRGQGAICVLPPSLHPAGTRYKWRRRPSEIPFVDSLRRTGLHKSFGSSESLRGESVITETGCLVITKQVQRAINRSLPRQRGERHRKIFQFAQELKAIPELAGLPADSLRSHFEEWHRQSVTVIGTKSLEANWKDFSEGWPRVRYAAGGSLQAAVHRALVSPVPEDAKRYKSQKKQVLVAVCRELHQMSGGTFFLSSYDAADFLNVTQPCAWNYLDSLCRDGVLKKTKSGDHRKREANEYHYLGETR